MFLDLVRSQGRDAIDNDTNDYQTARSTNKARHVMLGLSIANKSERFFAAASYASARGSDLRLHCRAPIVIRELATSEGVQTLSKEN
jgi:hypothetical protein